MADMNGVDASPLTQVLHLGHAGRRYQMQEQTRRSNPQDYLLFWVLAGRAYAELNANHSASKTAEIGPGDLCILPANVSQVEGAAPNQMCEVVWVFFNGKLAPWFYDMIRPADGSLVSHMGLSRVILNAFEEVIGSYYASIHGSTAHTMHQHTSLVNLLGLIIDKLRTQSVHGDAPSHGRVIDTMHIETFVLRNLNQSITLEQLAREAHLSPSHFIRLFRKQFGVSPMQYVIDQRIKHACLLLTRTTRRIDEIARSVGYDDPHYFSRIFRRVTGDTPRDYRAANVLISK